MTLIIDRCHFAMSKGSAVKLSFWLQEGDIILLERLPPVCRIECRWYILLNSTPHLLRAESEHILGMGKSIWWSFSILSSAEQCTCLQYFLFFQQERLFKIETSAKSMKQFIPNRRQEIWWPAKLLVLLRSEPLKMEVHFEMHSWELNAPFVYVCVLETRC